MPNKDKLIVFDGKCGLCHAWVKFVIRYDRHRVFSFASMQSLKGQAVVKPLGMAPDGFETMLYVENELVYIKSKAFIKIVRQLPFPVNGLSMLALIPGPLRDFVYDRIARNRYRIFGTRDECLLTEGDWRDRFL